jgi:hypothetical protein
MHGEYETPPLLGGACLSCSLLQPPEGLWLLTPIPFLLAQTNVNSDLNLILSDDPVHFMDMPGQKRFLKSLITGPEFTLPPRALNNYIGVLYEQTSRNPAGDLIKISRGQILAGLGCHFCYHLLKLFPGKINSGCLNDHPARLQFWCSFQTLRA